MGPKDMGQNYRVLIEQGLRSGVVTLRKNGNENRNDPRFLVDQGNLTIRVEPTFGIVDLSATGMAFLSDISFTPGAVITLYLEDAMGIQARIVGCFMIEVDADMLETRYRVQCRFENPEHGMRVLLLMSEINKLSV